MKVLHLDLRRLPSVAALDALPLHAAGFSHLCVGPLFQLAHTDDITLTLDHRRTIDGLDGDASPASAIAAMREFCERNALSLIVDLVLDRVSIDGPSARTLKGVYERPSALNTLDPRVSRAAVAAATLKAGSAGQAAPWWATLAAELAAAGAQGFRLLGLPGLPHGSIHPLVDAVGRAVPECAVWAWTPGLAWSRLEELRGARLSAVFASTCWWDGRAPWYVEEHEELRRLAPVVGVAGDPFGRSLPGPKRLRRDLLLAASTTHGLFVPHRLLSAGNEGDLEHAIDLVGEMQREGIAGELRGLTPPGGDVAAMLRVDSSDARHAGRGVVIALNADLSRTHLLPFAPEVLPPGAGVAMATTAGTGGPLQPDELRIFRAAANPPVRGSKRNSKHADRRLATAAASRSAIVIDRVSPFVHGGDFAAKHIVGRPLVIEADIFADGHDVLAAEIAWQSDNEAEKQTLPLVHVGNDRWRTTIVPRRIGRHSFAIEAWRDEYATLCHALEAKHGAGVDVGTELSEAAAFLGGLPDGPDINDLREAARGPVPDAVRQLTSEAARSHVAAQARRPHSAHAGPIAIDVERPQAEFASWYELFPRSLSGDAARHGTFDDVIAALPRVRAMGFDVLYFPPIHPIGRANRKGRNNSLTAGPAEPGSPYAIGSAEGGHDAIHPELGSPDDFRRLIAAAREQGLEIALDFAIQCAPDHPWLRQHPDWFRRRPDGTIKYAENPPKKYEDIVNVDFHAAGAVPELWLALRDVVLHWATEGVRLFRVDNPHTKPLTFWQWMIADVRERFPDVVFLSEAFTRPKMMYRLAKVGFSQSYTYFTWRNSKREIVDYLRELTTTEVVDFFRPHFFVNTPDINPLFLQSSGRPGFLIRACLAATLSGLWGVYSGFEICEAAALPGREEYLDSEKYELRPRDFTAPGNIVAEITLLNRLRRAYPALQTHRGFTFYNAFNDQVVVYGKRLPGERDLVLVAVSLDPHAVQQTTFEIPLWEWGLSDDGTLVAEDLVRGGDSVWKGKMQSLRLDPAAMPFAIWRLRPGEFS